eukprot:TRINITY_DN344_c1_g2_i2.p1 TRINITY_DN344_c1_g2~~TRINITY_DN344_c1_g2_i2.p1  ORF type:complete len:144 (-),score=57.20 TRINITY_DN344_c1_g2_i2:63-494(-)
MNEISSFILPNNDQLSCLSWDEKGNCFAVGTLENIFFIDPRISQIYEIEKAPIWGTRSLTFQNHTLTIGGGRGSIEFFDLRKRNMRITLQGKQLNACLIDQFKNKQFPPAFYTHNWDHTNRRLFIGGGPLLCSSKGCYASIFD